MYLPERHIFRKSAVNHHLEKSQQDILPYLVSPKSVLIFWLLLVIIVAVGVLVWSLPVPIHISGLGLVANDTNQRDSSPSSSSVFVFVQANQVPLLKSGQTVNLQLNKMGNSFQGTIAQIEPDLLSPQVVRQRYHFDQNSISTGSQPLATLIVKLSYVFPITQDIDTVLVATVTVDSKTIFSLFT